MPIGSRFKSGTHTYKWLTSTLAVSGLLTGCGILVVYGLLTGYGALCFVGLLSSLGSLTGKGLLSHCGSHRILGLLLGSTRVVLSSIMAYS